MQLGLVIKTSRHYHNIFEDVLVMATGLLTIGDSLNVCFNHWFDWKWNKQHVLLI